MVLQMKRKKDKAIAFDFDGTLIQGGLDKGIHILCSSWMACYNTGYRKYLNPDNPAQNIDIMVTAYFNYPGSPRFQQLSSIVNALVNGIPWSVKNPADLKVDTNLQAEYPKVKELYNSNYNALNSVSAEKYWKPFPAVKEALKTLYPSYDLYIASGVTEDILQGDVDHHHFDRSLFKGIYGGNRDGGSDKGSLLGKIKSLGYKDILFVGDATKDLEYAVEADVKFFRIKENNDYLRLLSDIRDDYFPDEKTMWSYTEEEKDDVRKKALYLLQPDNRDMSFPEMVDFIHI